MLETAPSFRPVRAGEGYPPLEDLGLIGDRATVALVGMDGSRRKDRSSAAPLLKSEAPVTPLRSG